MGSIVYTPNDWRTREVTKRICGHSGTMSIVFISSANFYPRFIQGFSKIATSLTAMLKTTGSSVVSAFEVDDNEVVGGGGDAGVGGSVIKQKVGSIVLSTRTMRKMSTHPFQVYQLRILSGLGFQTPRVH